MFYLCLYHDLKLLPVFFGTRVRYGFFWRRQVGNPGVEPILFADLMSSLCNIAGEPQNQLGLS